MAPHSSTPAWKILWMKEPDGLQSMGSRWVGHGLSDFTFTFHFPALEKEMATHSSVLAWRIPGTGEPGGLRSMGSHRVRHNWSDLAAAAAAGYCWLQKRLSYTLLFTFKRESIKHLRHFSTYKACSWHSHKDERELRSTKLYHIVTEPLFNTKSVQHLHSAKNLFVC